MNVQPILNRLLPVEEPQSQVLTLTLDAGESAILPHPSRVFLKEQLRRIVSGGGPGSPDPVQERLAGRMMRFVEEELRPGTRGLFLAAGPSVWEPVELAVGLRNGLFVGRTAYLAPLLEAAQGAPRAYVVQVDQRSVLIGEWELGLWREVERFQSDVAVHDVERVLTGRTVAMGPSPGAATPAIGGGTRDRFDQWTREAEAATVARAARKLGELDTARPAASVYFLGKKDMFEWFQDHLPIRLRPRSRHLGPALRRQNGELGKTAEREVRAGSRDRTEAELLEFHERRAQGRLVALGALEVLAELATGKVARVFLDADNPVPGMKCGTCGFRDLTEEPACAHCGGAMSRVSLTQEVVAHALRHPPLPITFVPRPAEWHAAAGGIAALLSEKGIRSKR